MVVKETPVNLPTYGGVAYIALVALSAEHGKDCDCERLAVCRERLGSDSLFLSVVSFLNLPHIVLYCLDNIIVIL